MTKKNKKQSIKVNNEKIWKLWKKVYIAGQHKKDSGYISE